MSDDYDVDPKKIRTAQAHALKLGLPLKIPINAKIRQPDCSAQFAELVGVRGDEARYWGECSCRHQYDIRVKFQKKKQAKQINRDGTISVGAQKGFKGHELESL